jgi:hypothetical protein
MHEIIVFSLKRSNCMMEWIRECGSDPSEHLRGDGYAARNTQPDQRRHTGGGDSAVSRTAGDCGLVADPSMIERGQAAFRRELPGLLSKHHRKWVAYHGDRLLGFGRSKTKLIQQCLRQGIPDEELLVRSIEPEIAEDLEVERRDSSNL